MILGYIAAQIMFTREKAAQYYDAPQEIPDKYGKSPEQLMGGHYSEYIEDKLASWKSMLTYPMEPLTLTSEDGLKLVGYLYRNGDSRNTAVLVHGYHSGGYEGSSSMALQYIKRGYNVFISDNRACTASEGSYITFGILESRDARRWLSYLAERFPEDRIVVHGVSLGGATVCHLADKPLPSQVKALIADCAYADMRSELAYVVKYTSGIPYFPAIPESEFWFHRYTGLRYDDETPLKSVSNARLPMLFATGTDDRYVPPENSEKLYEACPSEKELVLIEGAGHAAAHVMGREQYYGPQFAFLKRFLENAE